MGWQIDSSVLRNPFHTNFMAPNSALCLIAVSLAVLLRGSRLEAVSKASGLFAFLFGLATLLEYILHMDFGIDRIFMASKLGVWTARNVFTGRIAPNSALAFCLLGSSFLVPVARLGRTTVSELLTVPVLWISFLSVVGYAYGAESLYGISYYSTMALQTAFCLGLLSVAMLVKNSDTGIVELLLADDEGGMAARRLLLATVIILPVMGWIGLWAQWRGWFDIQFGTAILIIVTVMVFSFVIFQIAFTLHDLTRKRTLAEESLLRSHAQLESLVETRTSALRRLSTRLMQLQDEERRRIARELHDGLGQHLTALAIELDGMKGKPTSEGVAGCRELVDHAIVEIRTLSYLLHPPLLDEVGFASAAAWYVEGFAKRSGVEVSIDLPQDMMRLPDMVEIGLFRILQEALTNIHRHSGSRRAEVRVQMGPGTTLLSIRDSGKGIPEDVLLRWKETGAAGVGLTGMRERVEELGGKLEISSSGQGTTLTVLLPSETSQTTARPRAQAV
jgi:signal transduction histidine kinase